MKIASTSLGAINAFGRALLESAIEPEDISEVFSDLTWCPDSVR